MSIKTNKRLALGVIAALVFAPFAAIAPASAATGNITGITALASGGSAPAATATQVAGPSNFVAASVEVVATASYAINVAGGTASSASAGVTGSGTSSLSVAPSAGRTAVAITIPTPAVGTITVSFYGFTNGALNATATSTLTITVVASSPVGLVKASTSTSTIKAGATFSAGGGAATTDDTVSASRTASATPIAGIEVVLAQESGAIAGTTAVKAEITGPGILYLSDIDDHTTNVIGSGRSLSSTITAINAEKFYVLVAPDGNAGVATITITAGTFTATETVTFYGAITTLTASPVHGFIPDTADGIAAGDTDAIVAKIVATDAAGVVVPAVAGEYTASSTAEKTAQAVTNAATVLANAGTVNGVTLTATDLVLVVDPTATKTGAKTLTVTHTATKVVTTVSFNVSLVKANSVTLTTNKTSYLPGELVTVTLTAKDKNGDFVANGLGTAMLTGALTSSQSITSTLFDADVVTKSGIATATFYAPPIEGTVVLSGTVGAAGGTYVETALAATKLTLSVTVAKPVVPVVVPPVVYDNPTLSFVKDGGRVILSGTAVDGEGDIIIYTKKVGTTAWKERAKTLEVAAPGDFNGSMKAPKSNVLIRVKQEGTGQFSNQIIVLK